jgi:pyruvate dehydrogenase E2 component (dihydrolipoamide acetyltransferase)
MARLIDVRVPDMGSFSEVAVIDVLVKPGDPIEREASLITLETEKATMDVPSDVSGVIEKIHVKKGGKVSPGDVVATVRAEGEATAPAGAPAAAGGGAEARADARGAGPGASGASGSGATASAAGGSASASSGGTGSSATAKPASTASGSAPPAAPAAPAGAPASTPAAKNATPAPGAPASSGNGATAPSSIPGGRTDLAPINEAGFSRAHAGPSVRRFARELGVDLSQLTGTGFKARITHDDVKAFVKKALSGGGAAASGGAAAKGGTGLPTIPAVDFSKFGPVETKPLSRIQKISGPRLHASWVNIPHVTQFDEADITDLEDARVKLKQKAAKEGIKLTPLAFIVRACAKALGEFPFFNSSLDATGANLVLKKYVNIGFAADTPNGLVVPVIHNADKMDVYEIARQLADLSEKARGGKLNASEMQGGCFTISSLGGIGGTAFTPIINAPEVAILGVSKSGMKPVYKDGTFVPRLTLPLSLSYDHRVIDGAMAVRFTTYLAGLLADPRPLLEAVP